MKILITGAKGMLGTKLMTMYHGFDVIGLDIQELDITDQKAVNESVKRYKPDVLINSAAFTKVDECETKVDIAYAVNAEGPKYLAQACRDNGTKLVHVSTDYVFDGRKTTPYGEDDTTNPASVYGKSKLTGEENIRAVTDNYIIARTEWLYGEYGPNFVETILRIASEKDELRIVNDQTGSPTYTKDLAVAIKALIENNCRGTYHSSNSGSCTWYQFAVEIIKLNGLNNKIVPITTEEIARPAKRPAYSVFDCNKLNNETGYTFRHWKEALQEYIHGRKQL